LKQPGKAEEILRDVARVRRETLGPADPDTLESEGMIAVTLYEQGRLPEARDAYAEVLPRIKEVQGEGGLYLTVTVNYAGILYRLGQYQDAERILRDSVAAHERVFGAQYYGTYYTKMELGTTLVRLERYAEAEPLLLDALAGFREVYREEPNHSRVRGALDRLVRLYDGWAKPEKAAEFKALLSKAEAEIQKKRP
jgi:tetratricopeptide (TPR) repeat protein